jgi:hypothetical protein
MGRTTAGPGARSLSPCIPQAAPLAPQASPRQRFAMPKRYQSSRKSRHRCDQTTVPVRSTAQLWVRVFLGRLVSELSGVIAEVWLRPFYGDGTRHIEAAVPASKARGTVSLVPARRTAIPWRPGTATRWPRHLRPMRNCFMRPNHRHERRRPMPTALGNPPKQ